MANDTLERWATDETSEQSVIHEAVQVDSEPVEDRVCAKCYGECKVY